MKKGTLFILLTALVFSTMEIAGKLLSGELNAFQVTFIRFFIGALFLLPFALKDITAKKFNFRAKDFLLFILAGTICIPISMSLLQLSVEYTKAATAAVIFSTNPVFTMPFAFLILKESINRRMGYALAASIIGVMFIFNPFSYRVDMKGILIALLAAISFSLYSVISKKSVHRYGGYIYNFFTFLFGSLILLIILFVSSKPVIANITSANLPYLLYIGIIVTGLGYIFYLGAIKEVTAVKASMVFFIKPALAPILSFLWLRETIPLTSVMGILLIVFGSYVALRPHHEVKEQ